MCRYCICSGIKHQKNIIVSMEESNLNLTKWFYKEVELFIFLRKSFLCWLFTLDVPISIYMLYVPIYVWRYVEKIFALSWLSFEGVT